VNCKLWGCDTLVAGDRESSFSATDKLVAALKDEFSVKEWWDDLLWELVQIQAEG